MQSETNMITTSAVRNAAMLLAPPAATMTKSGVTAEVPAGAIAATDCATTATNGSCLRVSPRTGDSSAISGTDGTGGEGTGGEGTGEEEVEVMIAFTVDPPRCASAN